MELDLAITNVGTTLHLLLWGISPRECSHLGLAHLQMHGDDTTAVTAAKVTRTYQDVYIWDHGSMSLEASTRNDSNLSYGKRRDYASSTSSWPRCDMPAASNYTTVHNHI
uniref:Uncharacterized protein n=1 Tax=Oryza punctata TaxID=4537 RepID=A0A0E0JXH6_ORYPU